MLVKETGRVNRTLTFASVRTMPERWLLMLIVDGLRTEDNDIFRDMFAELRTAGTNFSGTLCYNKDSRSGVSQDNS